MRSIWKGAISFGLVNIPVKMYSASVAKEISFKLLHKKDMSEIRYARICETEDKEIPWEEIVKGYEYEKGNFVVFDDKDFEKINLKKTKTIDILSFIDESEINPIYFVKPYFLEPDKNGEKAYGLLRDALKKSKKVGLAKYVIRNREHIAALKFYENMIIVDEMRYANELINYEDLKVPTEKSDPKELAMAVQLIEQLTVPFDASKYKDTFTEEIKKAIKQKAKGKPVHPKSQEVVRSSKVHDIMSLLKASLDEKPRKKAKKTA